MDISSIFQFSVLSTISARGLLPGDKRPCFCNESLTGWRHYLILFLCKNNNVLFRAAMGQIWPVCEGNSDKGGVMYHSEFVCVR